MEKEILSKDLSEEQIKAEVSKFEPPFLDEHISREIRLPSGYNKDRIVVMVRDPWWIFVYWEITPEKEESAKKIMKQSGDNLDKSILRVYDITGIKDFEGKNASSFFDIPLKDLARNWYVDIGSPGKSWCAEIGLLSREGNFYMLSRSNTVDTPRFGISDLLDEKWMVSESDYWWLVGVSAGFQPGKSSLEMKELFQKRLKEWISSGGIVTLGSHILQQTKLS